MPRATEEQGAPRVQHSRTGVAQSLVSRALTVTFGVVLYFMYILTVGTKMFPNGAAFDGVSAAQISMLLFVESSFISQLMYVGLSSFNIGVMSSPISESFLSIRKLGQNVAEGVSGTEVFPTLFACLFIAGLLTGSVFLCFYALGAEKMLRKVPVSFSNSLFMVLGFFGILFANERIASIPTALPAVTVVVVFNLVGGMITLFFLWVRRHLVVVWRYSILFITAIGTAAFYLGAWYRGETVDSLVSSGWFRDDPRAPEAFVLPSTARESINYREIQRNALIIGEIVLINILQFPINFPPTIQQTKASAGMRKEFLMNGLGNIATSFFGGSSYLLPSSTIMVQRTGCSTRVDTALIGVGMGVGFVFLYRFFLYIPFVVYDLLLLFMAMTIVANTTVEVVNKHPKTIPMVACVTFASLVAQSIITGAFIAALAQVGVYAVHKYRAWRGRTYEIPVSSSYLE